MERRRRAEAALRREEARYRALVERLPVVVYVNRGDEVSTALYVSPGYQELLGFTAEERLADPELWVRRLHPEDRDRVLAQPEEGGAWRCEYRLLRKDGSVVWVRDEAVRVEGGEDGEPLWQGVLFDITARKEAEQRLREAEERLRRAEERYRTLVEQLPAVLYVDRPAERDVTEYVSPQVREILGIPPERYLADPDLWAEHLHPEDRERAIRAYHEAVRRGGRLTQEYRFLRPDGRMVWIRDDAVVLPDPGGGPPLVQGVMYDVTELKLAEEALRESERREREAAERLRALDEMKNTFLAAVSHELRSPLTAILGLALTLEQQADLPREDRVDLLSRLVGNARKLDRLLTDLLDIDRLQRGIVSPRYRTVDVGALVRRTVENLDAAADRRLLVRAGSAVARVDPAKLERIVENLVANAARHTAPDRTIWVAVREEAGGVLLAVEDDGPGVPPELRDAIFEPFRQGPTATPHTPGTGIGLSLVARFAELHGGRAWVEERAGGGASFRVWLPASPPGEGDGRDAAASSGAAAAR
ncbi:MAG TPA: PAS domain-containing sensor histidine kinase [Actinomycetota bacterium]|nr:PAS domain-containing sensor histidine kinase [Actinomycetota bacterium]